MVTRQRQVTIVMYHYVRDLAHSRYPAIKGLSLERFGRQLEHIDRHYTPITIGMLQHAMRSDQAELPPNSILLTFDDGYCDHFTNVFPLLDARGIQGCFFPPAQAVLEHKVLDVNKIHFILAAARDTRQLIDRVFTSLDEFRPQFTLRTRDEYLTPTAEVHRYDAHEVSVVKRLLQRDLPEAVRVPLVQRLFTEFVSADEAAFACELYMSVEQIACLKRNGMHIGSHTYSHPWLNHVTPAMQATEIDRSLQFLQTFGVTDTDWTICYPYGGFDNALLDLLRTRHCQLGFSVEARIADLGSDDRLTLPRLDTNDLPSLTSHGTRAVKTMMQILRDLTPLGRAVCSRDYDRTVDYLSAELPFRVIAADNTREHNGWVIPPSWDVEEATITKDGALVYDGTAHALGVIALSKGISATVSLDELKRHVHYDHRFDDAIPYHYRQLFRSWQRDWGFCMPKRTLDALTPGDYDVVIRTTESRGVLKMLEYKHAGTLDLTVVLGGNLDHAGVANDGLAGCVVGLEVLRRLQGRKTRFTYSLVLSPGIIGSEYYLAQLSAPERSRIFEGIFLEMLGSSTPLAVQNSRREMVTVFHALTTSLDRLTLPYRTGPFESIIVNDEYVWENYGIPMLSFSRFPYPEYHSSRDDLRCISERSLDEAVEALMGAIDVLESSPIVVKRFEGNVCLSNPQYDLYVDYGQVALGDTLSDQLRRKRCLMDLVPSLDRPVSVRALADHVGLAEGETREYLEEVGGERTDRIALGESTMPTMDLTRFFRFPERSGNTAFAEAQVHLYRHNPLLVDYFYHLQARTQFGGVVHPIQSSRAGSSVELAVRGAYALTRSMSRRKYRADVLYCPMPFFVRKKEVQLIVRTLVALAESDATVLCLLQDHAPCRPEIEAGLKAIGRRGQVTLLDPGSSLNALAVRLVTTVAREKSRAAFNEVVEVLRPFGLSPYQDTDRPFLEIAYHLEAWKSLEDWVSFDSAVVRCHWHPLCSAVARTARERGKAVVTFQHGVVSHTLDVPVTASKYVAFGRSSAEMMGQMHREFFRTVAAPEPPVEFVAGGCLFDTILDLPPQAARQTLLFIDEPIVREDPYGLAGQGESMRRLAERLLEAGPPLRKLIIRTHPYWESLGLAAWKDLVKRFPDTCELSHASWSLEEDLERASAVVGIFSGALTVAAASGLPTFFLQTGSTYTTQDLACFQHGQAFSAEDAFAEIRSVLTDSAAYDAARSTALKNAREYYADGANLKLDGAFFAGMLRGATESR